MRVSPWAASWRRRPAAPSNTLPLKTPAWTRFLFDTALRSDFLFWAAPRISRGAVTRAILATPPAVVEKASAAERSRVAEVIAHIPPVVPRRLGLLNDAAVTSVDWTPRRGDVRHRGIPALAAGRIARGVGLRANPLSRTIVAERNHRTAYLTALRAGWSWIHL